MAIVDVGGELWAKVGKLRWSIEPETTFVEKFNNSVGFSHFLQSLRLGVLCILLRPSHRGIPFVIETLTSPTFLCNPGTSVKFALEGNLLE